MFKRFTMIAVLGFILSVVFAPVASAESDVMLVSPQSVELPATIVFASSQPTAEPVLCFTGATESYGHPAPGQPFDLCDPYFVNRTGPDSNGLYYFSWRLSVSLPGQTNFRVGAEQGRSDEKTLSFTVTGNRFSYGDFRTCIDTRTNKALIAWYATMTTEITFQLEEKTHQGSHWVWKAQKARRQQVEVGGSSGHARYSRRFARFKVPVDLLPPSEAHYNKEYDNKRYQQHLVRGRYLIKKGSHVIKKGYVAARKPCQELPFSPYVQP